MKTIFKVIASMAILTAGVIFVFMATEFILIVAGLALGILGFYALWNPPAKHKDFSLHDQSEAAIRAGGGSGLPDLSQLEPREQKKRKQQKE